jgi:ParB-like chromosome segregation protein Spo0J
MPKLALEKIVIDESLYPRNGVSGFNVNRLINAIESGAKLPPIIIENKTCRLVDGRHRYEAYKNSGLKTIEVIEKVYKNEADLYADAVRLNVVHGEPLDLFTIRTAIIRLTSYGYSKEEISEVVRLPIEQITKAERRVAHNESGEPVALKGGLAHLAGQTLDRHQQEINRRYSGPKALFFVRQISGLLANNMHPTTAAFADEMDALCKLWREVKAKAAA